jgi:hypothetical protein
MPLDPLHARIVEIAADLAQAKTVALAGGGAMLAHGLLDRSTRDVDLFTDRDADEAIAVCAALRQALADVGWGIERAARPPHDNRFVAVEPSGQRVQVEVFCDGGRLRPLVVLDCGPVLHRDDLAADKVLALWSRGEPRDVLDVAALLDVYGGAALIELAAAKDRGFTQQMLAEALRGLERLAQQDWTDAGVDVDTGAAAMRRVQQWRDELATG